MSKISVVINTRNEATHLVRCLESVKTLDEIVVVDMHSSDNSREIAQQFTSHVFMHEPLNYVEPARNFGIKHAHNDWILVLDPDEEVPATLPSKLIQIAKTPIQTNLPTHYFMARKNMIFGQWISHSGWWPDYQLRFFHKGSVVWQDAIHSIPKTTGEGIRLDADESLALIHHHYTSVSQWIVRMDRYTNIQSQELHNNNYHYQFSDNLAKPFSEFIRRFFVWQGYKDGITGLNLALLQALSELVVYLKVRELQSKSIPPGTTQNFMHDLQSFFKNSQYELSHYLVQIGLQNKIKHILHKFIK